MSDGYRFLLIMGGVFVLLLAVILYRKVVDQHRKKKSAAFEARSEMLRTLPQLSISEFGEVIKSLGWVMKDVFLGTWFISLPAKGFSSWGLIGQAIGTIIEHWEELSGEKDQLNLQRFASDLVARLDPEEIEQLISGVTFDHLEAANSVRKHLIEIRSSLESTRKKENRKEVIEVGIRASRGFISKS